MDKTETAPEPLVEAVRYFADPDVCLKFLAELRWPNGVTCPTCGSQEVFFLANQRRWKCRTKHERQQFSVKVGTIFEDSPLGLDKWLPAVWMIVNDKNGISSYEVARALGITQKSAWFMMHRIRVAMQRGGFDKFSGGVEVDETFIGGNTRFMHKGRKARMKGTARGTVGKTAVMGLLERHGPDGHSRMRANVVSTIRTHTLDSEVRKHVTPGSEVYTDALRPIACPGASTRTR